MIIKIHRSVPQSRVDDMVTRILWAMYYVGIMDNPQTGNLSVNTVSNAHNVFARNAAAEAHVLLVNNGILPLKPSTSSTYTIAMLGNDCIIHIMCFLSLNKEQYMV